MSEQVYPGVFKNRKGTKYVSQKPKNIKKNVVKIISKHVSPVVTEETLKLQDSKIS